MCLCSSACNAKQCPICGNELEYRDCTDDHLFALYRCGECNRNFEWDEKKQKWIGITKQIELLAGCLQYFKADSRAIRELIFEILGETGSIQRDSLILQRGIELLQIVQTRIQKHISDITERVAYQEKIKPMSKMQRLSLKREREELL
jgi:hypothetical protein